MLIGFTALGSYHEGSSWHFTWVQFCLGGFWLKIPRIKRSNYTVVCGMSVLLASTCVRKFFWPPFPKHIWVFGVTLFLILFLIYWFVTLVAASYRLLNKALVIIFSMSIGFAFCYGAFLEPLSLISKPVFLGSPWNPIRIATLFWKEKSSMTLIDIFYCWLAILSLRSTSLRFRTKRLGRSRHLR